MSEIEVHSPFFETVDPRPIDKATFIDRWLLHRLRHSRIEVLQFKSHPNLLELVARGCDGNRISQMALTLWFQDGSARIKPLLGYSAG
jgi:hypothetical protein